MVFEDEKHGESDRGAGAGGWGWWVLDVDGGRERRWTWTWVDPSQAEDRKEKHTTQGRSKVWRGSASEVEELKLGRRIAPVGLEAKRSPVSRCER